MHIVSWCNKFVNHEMEFEKSNCKVSSEACNVVEGAMNFTSLPFDTNESIAEGFKLLRARGRVEKEHLESLQMEHLSTRTQVLRIKIKMRRLAISEGKQVHLTNEDRCN